MEQVEAENRGVPKSTAHHRSRPARAACDQEVVARCEINATPRVRSMPGPQISGRIRERNA
jgi:hypothetical protein